jgi:hypothetical protein
MAVWRHVSQPGEKKIVNGPPRGTSVKSERPES